MSDGHQKGDYEVGYGRPPVATRFKPGQSGNPKGARRKVRPSNMNEAVNAALMKRLTVTIDGKRKQMTRAEIIAEDMTLKAAKGDLEAQRELLKMDQIMAKLNRQYPAQKAELEPVRVTLKIGDEETERRVHERLIEDRLKALKAKGEG